MPHLVILYTQQIEPVADMGGLCRRLADAMLACTDDEGKLVFPVGGTRVLAYPTSHHAVADGSGDHAFIHLNLRMGSGRSAATLQRAGEQLAGVVRAHVATLLAERVVGITLQIDESQPSFDARLGNLHAHFNSRSAR